MACGTGGHATWWRYRGPKQVGATSDRRRKVILCDDCVHALGKAADLWEFFEERAAIMEYDGGLSKAEAEKQARLEVLGNAR